MLWLLLRIAEHHSAGWIFWKWTLQSFLNQKWAEVDCFAYGVIQCSDIVIETNIQRIADMYFAYDVFMVSGIITLVLSVYG